MCRKSIPCLCIYLLEGNEIKVKKCEFFVNLTKIFGLYAENWPFHPYLLLYKSFLGQYKKFFEIA